MHKVAEKLEVAEDFKIGFFGELQLLYNYKQNDEIRLRGQQSVRVFILKA